MKKYIAGIFKEFWLLKRDIHALMVLFVMPSLFILIMSLAMRDAFSENSDVHIKAVILCEENSSASRDALAHLKKIKGFEWSESNSHHGSELPVQMMDNNILLGVVIRQGFDESIRKNSENSEKIAVLISPEATPMAKILFETAVGGTVAKISMVNQMSLLNPWMTREEKEAALAEKVWFEEHFLHGENTTDVRPTSVQQSVPAWLIFSMFFIIIPISNTFVNERRLGTLARLAVMNVSIGNLLVSKMIPYFVINQIQFVAMLMVGMFIVPQFGGDALSIGNNSGSLLVVSSVLSFASISYALALASFVKTTDQAVTIGGVLNIIFAAIGGIMIPLFVMPEFMQKLALLSPMSWGLESFLALFLHDASLGDIWKSLGALILFGGICLGLAAWILSRELREAR
jgi:ABC-2 type transport system permease protein